MTPENFVYWLQGYVELNGTLPSEDQWEDIKNHLSLVFAKSDITWPSIPTVTPIWPTTTKTPAIVTC